MTYISERNRGWLLSLIAIIFMVYASFMGNTLFFDDLPFFQRYSSDYTQSGSLFELRGIANNSLYWTWKLFGDTPDIYHLQNIVLHAINTILLYFLLRQVLILVVPENNQAIYFNWSVWLATLFFALNPAAVYAVGYIVERSILMATLFSLAMQLAYLRGLIYGEKRWLVLSVIFFFISVFSKEHSVMTPLILPMFSILLRTKIRIDQKYLYLTWLGYAVVTVSIIMAAKGIFGSVYEIDAPALFNQQQIEATPQMLYLFSICTQAGLFFKYLLLWWLPNPAWMSIDMRETFLTSLITWQFWLGPIGFVSYGLAAIWLLLRKGKAGLIGFALLYPWLFFVIEFSTVRVQEPFVLYRSYLWVPGMLLLIPIALQAINKKSAYIVFTALTLLLIPFSWNRLWVFSDSYLLWNDAAILLKNDHVAGAARIFYNRGNAELANQQWKESLADFERVIAINPKIEQAQLNLGIAYFGLKNYQNAIDAFDQALLLKPDDAYAYYAKAICFKRLHQDDMAVNLMKQSCTYGNTTACIIVSSFSKE